MEPILGLSGKTPETFAEVFAGLGLQGVQRVWQHTERYGEEDTDIRFFDVYLLETGDRRYTLKKTDAREVLNYSRYLAGGAFPVPAFYGAALVGGAQWVLLEDVEGETPVQLSDGEVQAVAMALSRIRNTDWPDEAIDRERFAAYLARIEKRARYAETRPELKEAYERFLQRQRTAPRTLSHGDLAQFNLCRGKDGIVILDWGFGGIMPYSLDIARFIAHAEEDGGPFGMVMTEAQKQLFLDTLYAQLEQKPAYAQYREDIRLALLNEYVEFMEADEDEDHWYEERAVKLAAEILQAEEKSPV